MESWVKQQAGGRSVAQPRVETLRALIAPLLRLEVNAQGELSNGRSPAPFLTAEYCLWLRRHDPVIRAGFVDNWVHYVTYGDGRPRPWQLEDDLTGNDALPVDELLPSPARNDLTAFHVLSRQDVIDLREIVRVPAHLHATDRQSRSHRKTRLELVRTDPRMTNFHWHSKTSGMPNEVNVVRGRKGQFRKVRDPGENQQRLRTYELTFNIDDAELFEPHTLEWDTVSWNKFQGSEEHWWVSAMVEFVVRRSLCLIVKFPPLARIGLEDLRLTRGPIENRIAATPIQRSDAQLDELAPGQVKWTIDQPLHGFEYAMHWRRSPFAADEPG